MTKSYWNSQNLPPPAYLTLQLIVTHVNPGPTEYKKCVERRKREWLPHHLLSSAAEHLLIRAKRTCLQLECL